MAGSHESSYIERWFICTALQRTDIATTDRPLKTPEEIAVITGGDPEAIRRGICAFETVDEIDE